MDAVNRPGPDNGPGPDSNAKLAFEFDGRAGEITSMVIVNALLTLLTVGIYRFWARTRVRRYLWSHMRLLGDRLEYTGTGKELFLGFLIVFFVVLLPLVLANMAAEFFLLTQYPVAYGVFMAGLYLFILFLVGVAQYRAQRYRLSRTNWRGIRGGLPGSSVRYGLAFLGFTLLLPFSLGWTYPWQRMTLMRMMMNETRFGDRKFSFDGRVGPLMGAYAVTWFALIVLWTVVLGAVVGGAVLTSLAAGGEELTPDQLGAVGFLPFFVILLLLPVSSLIATWYRAREFAYMGSCTRYEGLQFRFDATFGSLFRLGFGNLLIVLFTLGMGLPYAQLRNFRYFCARLSAEGQVDFEAIRQSAELRPSVGEGLADAFDGGTV